MNNNFITHFKAIEGKVLPLLMQHHLNHNMNFDYLKEWRENCICHTTMS